MNISLAVIAIPFCFPFPAPSAERETEHFRIRGKLPADTIESIYEIFSEKIFTPTGTSEKISVRIEPRLLPAGFEGKARADRISLASFNERTFIHEMAHYLWEIRGWKPRPWLAEERAKLKSNHPLVREEFLNHYLIYAVIVPRVEEIIAEGTRP